MMQESQEMQFQPTGNNDADNMISGLGKARPQNSQQMQFQSDGVSRGSMKQFGGDISGINPNETVGFLSAQERSELFGKGSMQPDVMKIPSQQQLMSMGNLGGEDEDYSQLQGEFKIERGFAG